MAQRSQCYAKVSKQDVVQRQLFLDQLDDALNTINNYLAMVKAGQARQPAGQMMASLCSTSLNNFALASNRRHETRDKRALSISSKKLEEWVRSQKLPQKQFAAIAPMVKYLHCCTQRRIDTKRESLESLDNAEAYGAHFTQSNVGKGMAMYTQSGHAIDNKAKRYEKNFQSVDASHDAQYRTTLHGHKRSQLFKDAVVPSSDAFYQTSVENPKYRDFSQRHDESPDVDMHMDCAHTHGHGHGHEHGRRHTNTRRAQQDKKKKKKNFKW